RASTDSVGQKADAEMARCARASSIRSIAARRSRFDLEARSISESSVGSLKLLHQALWSAACSVTALVTGAGGAVARADQCGGVCGVGRTKSGPMVQPAARTVASAALAAPREMRRLRFTGL